LGPGPVPRIPNQLGLPKEANFNGSPNFPGCGSSPFGGFPINERGIPKDPLWRTGQKPGLPFPKEQYPFLNQNFRMAENPIPKFRGPPTSMVWGKDLPQLIGFSRT